MTSSLLSRNVQYQIDSSKRYFYPRYKNPPVYSLLTNEKVSVSDFDLIVEMAYYFQYIAEFPFTYNKRFVGLYTDSYPHEGPSFDYKSNQDLKKLSREEFYNIYLKPYDGIIVGNTNLYEDYAPYTSKMAVANGIYLQEDFEENLNVGKNKHLTIAWTGNPDRPMKGFREFIEPAIKAVQDTGREVILKTKFSGDYKELLSFYKDVDLVLIASFADTGPSLFAEASLSSVPSISTNIGFPKMIIKHNENGMIVNRNVDDMKNAIIELYDNREKLVRFSKRIKTDYLEILSNQKSINNLISYINKI
ncbi:MAG: glycosyltransferase [Flavobacteriaceae bacterium]|nr:glycosyltransferase [Flavobacteriaceae bacterium]